MKVSSCLLLLGLVTLITCSNVVNLTDENFNSTISGHKYVMVKFFAPWCGHCQTMAPEYERLAELIKDNDVVIGQVDATIAKQTAQQYKVQGYPTVKFFIDGVDIDYRGPRTADVMYGWIKKIFETELEEITQERIDELKQKQNLVVYFGSNQDKRKIVELLSIVDSTLNYFVSPSEDEKLVLYPLGREPIEFSSNLTFTVDEIKSWAMLNTIPTVVPLSSKEYLDWVFYDTATMKDVVMLLKEDDLSAEGFKNFESFCQQNREQFKCCVIDSTMEVYSGVKNYLRSKGNSVLALARDALKQAYAYPGAINELTSQSWKQFTTEVNSNQHLNMAATDTDKIEYSHVKVLDDSNFTSFIKDNEVVFVEFYTTTCAHCVEFAKKYDELAKKVHADQKLNYQIAALDIKQNKEVASQLLITSFPTFMVFVNGHKVLYDGPRTYEAIVGFIKSAAQSRPIAAGSIAEVPTPSVVIYDPAEESSIKLLPALFTRYPIYHIREGNAVKVVLRAEQQQNYTGDLVLEDISKWLHKKTDPVLVNLLNPNIDNKLREALESKTHILGLIDNEPSLSVSLQSTLEEYCKASTLVCGYAKKDESNFAEFTKWLGIDADTVSTFVYINTETFDRYLFPKKIEELNVENIGQFITDVKEGKVLSITDSKIKEAKEEQKQQKEDEKQSEDGKEDAQSDESEDTEESEDKISEQQQL